MNESTRLNAKVSVPGKTKTKLQRHLTLEMISGWIKLQGFDDYTTQGLIDLAAGYPTQALPSFRRNFNLMIERVRQKRKKEMQGEVVEEVAPIISSPVESSIPIVIPGSPTVKPAFTEVSSFTELSDIPEVINLKVPQASTFAKMIGDKIIFPQDLKEKEHGEENTPS